MRNKELINKNVLFLILILIPIFKPVGITIIDNINKIFQVWKIASICIMSIYIFKNRKNNKYEYSIPLVIFWVIYIITSFIYKGDYPLTSQHAGYSDEEVYIPLIVVDSNEVK